jgi:hypothetical protein
MRARLTHRPGLARRRNRREWHPKRPPIKDAAQKVASAWESACLRMPDTEPTWLSEQFRKALK